MKETITPHELAHHKNSGNDVRLIDVRTPAEFRSRRIEFSESVPLDQLDTERLKKELGDSPVYVICGSGSRASQACKRLLEAALRPVLVEGGLAAWEAAGLPVEQAAKGVISLERQVRIGAGSMVLLGVILGTLLHPSAYLLSAFVGAGLIFAGVTDWCGLGLLLAKAPWNRLRALEQNPTCPLS